MKDSFKTGYFASKWLIEIEAKGTNQRKNQSFGVNIETNLKRRVCCFGFKDVSIAGRHSTGGTYAS